MNESGANRMKTLKIKGERQQKSENRCRTQATSREAHHHQKPHGGEVPHVDSAFVIYFTFSLVFSVSAKYSFDVTFTVNFFFVFWRSFCCSTFDWLVQYLILCTNTRFENEYEYAWDMECQKRKKNRNVVPKICYAHSGAWGGECGEKIFRLISISFMRRQCTHQANANQQFEKFGKWNKKSLYERTWYVDGAVACGIQLNRSNQHRKTSYRR